MAQELFDIGDGTAVSCNPGGRFHGWLFRRHPDGLWISVRKLEPTDIPDPLAPFEKPFRTALDPGNPDAE